MSTRSRCAVRQRAYSATTGRGEVPLPGEPNTLGATTTAAEVVLQRCVVLVATDRSGAAARHPFDETGAAVTPVLSPL
jgi:hypothetical protein